MISSIGWTAEDRKRRQERIAKEKARTAIRCKMADAANLRNRAENASRLGPGMIKDALTLEREAHELAAEFNLGDPRFV